jgi:hypothetical protein
VVVTERRGSRSPYFFMGCLVAPALILIGLVIMNDARPDVDLHVLWTDVFISPFGWLVETLIGLLFFGTGMAIGFDAFYCIRVYALRLGIWALATTLFLLQCAFAALAMIAGYGLSWGIACLSFSIFWGLVVLLILGPPMKDRRRGQ